MRVLIVDDERAARDRLLTMLEELDVEVVGVAENGVRALELANERRPDVILLDIAMPEIDGFDVARHLPEPRPLIIFQTAHDEFALKAFEFEAVDYVVKPVVLDRLRHALERAERRLRDGTAAQLTGDLLDRIQDAVGQARAGAKPRLLVRQGAGHRLLPLREIARFTAHEGRAVAHTTAGRFDTDYTLAQLEQRTTGSFVRLSRSDLVNIERIERFERDPDGTGRVRLTDGSVIPISRRRATEVRAILEG